jgi:hypothetical protein
MATNGVCGKLNALLPMLDVSAVKPPSSFCGSLDFFLWNWISTKSSMNVTRVGNSDPQKFAFWQFERCDGLSDVELTMQRRRVLIEK